MYSTIVQFSLQVFVFTGGTLTSIYNFQVRHTRCVEYKLNFLYTYIYICHTQLYILLDYNSSYMFRPNCRPIFRLIFEQMECTECTTLHLFKDQPEDSRNV